MTLNKYIAILLLLVAMSTIVSCSGGKAPVTPGADKSDLPATFGTLMEDRNIIAVYDAVIDPEAKTFTITPVTERDLAYHFALTNLYPGCVSVTGFGWLPNFWADIKITHPLPGSGIDGFDPRVIAVIPANAGVSFNYPNFAAHGNNKVLLHPHDGWTELFDGLGGPIIGTVNPFICYMKDHPHRIWPSTGAISETIRWNLSLPGFGGPIVYRLIVDVSSNFPAPPTPVVDNMKEPLVLTVNVGPGLTPTGGSASVEVLLLDWQGTAGIMCQVESPALFTGLVNLAYDSPGPSADTYVYTGNITNSNLAPAGVYPILAGGRDAQARIYNYAEAKAEVKLAGESKVHSEIFREKIPNDTWFDIAVREGKEVLVVADHPETGNIGGSGEDGTRTALQFSNDLSAMTVINSGTGMASPYPDNWDYTEEFRRIDISAGGTVINDVGGNTLGTWVIAGGTATSYACCWQYNCGLMSTIADIADHDNPVGYGTGLNCFAVLNVGCSPQVEWTLAFPDSDPANYSGYNFAATMLFPDIYSVKGIACIEDTLNEVLLYSSSTEARLCIVGDCYDFGGDLAIIQASGSYGTGDGQFKGGLDLDMDSKGNILTLEDHGGGVFRFQKFDRNLTWIWSSPWIHPGAPQRMDFDKSNDLLYLLCDIGIHVCYVD